MKKIVYTSILLFSGIITVNAQQNVRAETTTSNATQLAEKTSLLNVAEKELGKGTFNIVIKDKKNKIKTLPLKTIENVTRAESISYLSKEIERLKEEGKEIDSYTHSWSVNKN